MRPGNDCYLMAETEGMAGIYVFGILVKLQLVFTKYPLEEKTLTAGHILLKWILEDNERNKRNDMAEAL